MAKYTVIGDPHAKPTNLDKINTLFDIAEDLGNSVIILGDLLDTKEMVRGKCLNLYYKRMRESKLSFTLLVGNHDWFNLECEEHSLEPLKELRNVTVVDTAISNELVAFLPYMKDQEKLKEAFKLCAGKVVFCHVDMTGFDYGNGLISGEGLTLADVQGAKRVFSGHYHKYQEIGTFTYLGTPFSHSFGESNQDKYICVYDTDADTIDLFPTPFPRHITIDLDCSVYSGHHYNDVDIQRVILRGTQEEIDRVQREENVKYIEEPTSVVKARVINETESPQLQFTKWAKDIKGYSDEVVELGLEILNDV